MINVHQTGAKGYSWEARCSVHRNEETYLTNYGAVAFNTRGVGNRKWEHAMAAACEHLKKYHTFPKGMGIEAHVRHRRDAILAVLAQAHAPMPTMLIVQNLHMKGMNYGKVYADLRHLCGSMGSGLTYQEIDARPDFNMEGYPVVWHKADSALSDGGTTWSITRVERERRASDAADLEAILGLEQK